MLDYECFIIGWGQMCVLGNECPLINYWRPVNDKSCYVFTFPHIHPIAYVVFMFGMDTISLFKMSCHMDIHTSILGFLYLSIMKP